MTQRLTNLYFWNIFVTTLLAFCRPYVILMLQGAKTKN
ncbi:hypothetical protein GPLA_4326 [Paraglaciecola polaris LMG 21857]|uniref:Uncharacterized protein n=1 Tax=Paraglaciecola polaris LMG 21857 TaxID=1129793 RepID=K7AIZ4_9ALTE|nr:hypothetical protein GPLA_4326 [Paraglaciecola polaris LMG 21857]